MVFLKFALKCRTPENALQVIGSHSRISIFNKLGRPGTYVNLIQRVPLLKFYEGVLLLFNVVVCDLNMTVLVRLSERTTSAEILRILLATWTATHFYF